MFAALLILALILVAIVGWAFLSQNGYELFTLAEHRRRSAHLSDLLPWARLVAPGIVMNKNGSLQASFGMRGPDLYSETHHTLISVCARINNVFKRLEGGWALYAENRHHPVSGYPKSDFPDAISYLVDEERRIQFESGIHYESDVTLTLVYMPPRDTVSRLAAMFYEGGDTAETKDLFATVLETFQRERVRMEKMLAALLPEFVPLNDDETLTYLHACVSPKDHKVAAPEVPLYLDAFITDTPFTGGLAPKLGDHHIGVVTVRNFPASSMPGLLDELNRLPINYRWVTRYIAMDKTDAVKALGSFQQKWLSARKKLISAFKEALFGEESQIQNSDAVNQAADADVALQELQADMVAYGFFTQVVVLLDEDAARLKLHIREVSRVFENLGFTVADEISNHNCIEAWLGSIPGNCNKNVRHPILNTLNLTHLFPLSSIWAGAEGDENLAGPPLAHAVAEGATPYRLSLNVGDVGHTILFGPTGMGKSVLLNFLALQFRRYPGAQVFGFDKDASCLTTTYGVGGDFYDLGEESLAFQPLANIDKDGERNWANEWAQTLIAHEGVTLSPEDKGVIWKALTQLAASPKENRTISGLRFLIQDPRLKEALKPYTVEGPYGRFLDAEHDNLAYGRWQYFEMGKLIAEYAHAVMPVLTFLFHRLEERFTGVPTLLPIDEGWLFLDDPVFGPKLRVWLKTLRKKKVYVVFATQNPADVVKSRIFDAVRESCFTRIFLPNPDAMEPTAGEAYKKFGLNDRQLEIIATALPKRQYYYVSPLGNRLFDLNLGPLAIAYCGATSIEDRVFATELQAMDPDRFNSIFLNSKGLDWAAEIIDELEGQAERKRA